MALLTFLGAAQQVTGSCYLIETYNKQKILLECGMQQGSDLNENNKQPVSNSAFKFDPKQIDAVVLSHAHIDHSGMLPRLVAEGYQGPVYTTEATSELLEIMMLDSAHIQEKDAEWENRWRARKGKPPIKPLYITQDAERALSQRAAIAYKEGKEILPGVVLKFYDAGHIIGSAIVELTFHEPHNSTRRLVFSGDLGNTCTPLMRTPELVRQADVLLMESTYGDRNHRCSEDTLDELANILEQAHADQGNVMIPAFSVGRTQDILFHLGRFYREGRLPQKVVYLDSPMAIRANAVYFRHHQSFDEKNLDMLKKAGVQSLEDWLPIIKQTPQPDDSMAINRVKSGAIIIAGSGMCNGGRIVHHLKHNLWRPESHLVFTGFQARGTTGRSIVDGVERLKILRDEIVVNAKVHTLGGFSAHAGQQQLLDWLSGFENQPELHLIHGESETISTLQSVIKQQFDWQANIPQLGDRIAI